MGSVDEVLCHSTQFLVLRLIKYGNRMMKVCVTIKNKKISPYAYKVWELDDEGLCPSKQ